MKRARPAPALFATDSDSDSSSGKGAQRFKPLSSPPTGSASASPSPRDDRATTTAAPDSLDAFMSTLTPSAPSIAAPLGHSLSSDDETPLPPSPERRIRDDAEPSRGDVPEHARDLVLAPVDYSNTKLSAVSRGTYEPPSNLRRSSGAILVAHAALGAHITGTKAPIAPLEKFEDMSAALPSDLLAEIQTAFDTPTSVQALALPILLSGRDAVVVAATGSGKTLAYGAPLLAHVRHQPGGSTGGRGPSAVVLAPTRELVLQIARVLRRFGGAVCAVVAGIPKYEQFKRLRDGGSEVVVATPGRFIDMLKMKACRMARCSFVVLDEADRMLDMGFEGQVSAILGQVRPDSQRVLFSATFPRFVDRLAAELLHEAVKIVISDSVGAGAGKGRGSGTGMWTMVNEAVREVYVDVVDADGRTRWLREHLGKLTSLGLVIVFCGTRGDAAATANKVRQGGMAAACVHGETDAGDRQGLLRLFSSGDVRILVTTDVSARGLDIANVQTVVNCGCAKSWEWHIHRVGRTGRAGRVGTAYTLVSRSRADGAFIAEAVRAYRAVQTALPDGLEDVARTSENGVSSGSVFSGRGRGRGYRKRAGGRGRGYRGGK